ncbi:hypothetical protein PAXRUDRAFT_156319, partial [Paxillus rubicundulus Ve08.2h10]
TADIWSDKNMQPFLATTAHWIAKNEALTLKPKTALIGFYHLPRSHTGKNISNMLLHLLNCARITEKVCSFIRKIRHLQ